MKKAELEKLVAKQKDEIEKLSRCLDIERQRFLSELNKTKEYYEGIIAVMPGHVYWLDRNNVYMGCNDLQALNAKLQSRYEIVGKTNYDMPWREQAEELNRINNLVMATGKSQTREEFAIMVNGPGTFFSQKVPLRDKKNNIIGIIGISVDITEQKKLEAELRKAKEDAETANMAKTEFIANMGHDIRTPLTGVVGMAKLLEDNLQDKNQKQYAHWLGESGYQLLHMLNEILDMVSADNVNDSEIHEELFNLHDIIQNIVQLERPSTVFKGIDLIIHIDDSIPTFLISDHSKLHRILLNLLGNAIKFTEVGQVKIDLELLKKNQTHALIRFCVSDTGIGIPLELQTKVFDQFFRITPSYKGIYKGHGLGLHIAQSYTNLLGGKIFLTSEIKVGTTFYFDLSLKISRIPLPIPTTTITPLLSPANLNLKYLTSPELPVAETDTSVTLQDSMDSPCILLVEDNKIALLTLENLITQVGCCFVSAIDGEIALDLATNQFFDLIITDLGLPGLSGIDLAYSLRALEYKFKKNPIPIIGLTAHAEEKIKQECLDAGMNDVLSKPMTFATLKMIKTTYLESKISSKANLVIKSHNNIGKLGPDLPDCEEELFQLDAFSILDVERALVSMESDVNLLRSILKSMVDIEIPKDMIELDKAYFLKDWNAIEKIAHRMKGGFLYCGTIKLVHACQFLERYHKAGHSQSLDSLYKQLLTIIDETLLVVNNWLKVSIKS